MEENEISMFPMNFIMSLKLKETSAQKVFRTAQHHER